jgi:AcrR family transcriptional regulator
MTSAPRKPARADAARNRNAVVRAAAEAFAADGPDVSLEEIARRAGVGIGTLYRHFSGRPALIEAVYQDRLSELCDAAPALLHRHEPIGALREWMWRVMEFSAAKRAMAEAFRRMIDHSGDPYYNTMQRMRQALDLLIDAGQTEGALRPDIDYEDVFWMLAGIGLAVNEPGQQHRVGRLIDLLIDALRHRR